MLGAECLVACVLRARCVSVKRMIAISVTLLACYDNVIASFIHSCYCLLCRLFVHHDVVVVLVLHLFVVLQRA